MFSDSNEGRPVLNQSRGEVARRMPRSIISREAEFSEKMASGGGATIVNCFPIGREPNGQMMISDRSEEEQTVVLLVFVSFPM